MNPVVRVWLMLAGVILFIFFVSLVRKQFPKRTLPDWGGDGVNQDLLPPEAGILLGCLPGQIVASLTAWLVFRGRVAIRNARSLELEWTGDRPADEVEAAFLKAIEGGNREEDHAEVLEAGRQAAQRMGGLLSTVVGQL